MIKKNSQSYRLMPLVAMSGECSVEALGILLPQESYRKKLLMQLVRDKWIRLYEKDGLRGYRLSRRGKDLLLQIDGERFGFFLEDGADAAMRRSKLVQRERQHRISESLAMMESSDTEIFRDRKKKMFEYSREKIGEIAQPAFFVPKEVKVQSDLTRKIINSKLTGVWLTESAVWICYNMGTHLINWYENVEQRADILVRSILKMQGIKHETSSMILFGHSMEQALYCLDDPKTNAYIMNSFFERVCFIPLNEYGEPLLRLIGDADMYEHLLNSLKEDLQEENLGRIECDGFDPDGRYVLICTDMDMKRLIWFNTQMRYIKREGEVYCFGFQKDAIRSFCGENIRVTEIDLDVVKDVFGFD